MRVELLLERIARNEKVKSSLEQIDNLPEDGVIEALMNEFEQVVERYKDLSFYAGQASWAASHANPPSPSYRIEKSSEEVKGPPFPPLLVDPIKIELPQINLHQTPISPVRPSEAKKARMRKELESIEQLVSGEIQRAWENRPDETVERILLPMTVAPTPAPNVLHVSNKPQLKTETPAEPLRIKNEMPGDDLLYLYGLEIPEASEKKQSAGTIPTIKGIDTNHPIFEYRWKGHTFFISKTSTDCLTLTSSGVMLLGKQESVALAAKHEEILNTLRVSKRIVPFIFGAVVRGKEELMKKLSAMESTLQNAVEHERQLNSWTLKLHVLDTQVAKLLGDQHATMGIREQGRGEKANRVDIKLLEKVLNHERNIAEGVHNVLSLCSLSSTIVSMVSVGQGTSPDWKLIFHASYDTDGEGRKNFFTAVHGLQEEYKEVGLMLSVSGIAGRLDFSTASADLQATSA